MRKWTEAEINYLFSDLVGFYHIDRIVVLFNKFCRKNNLPERTLSSIQAKIYNNKHSALRIYDSFDIRTLARFLNINRWRVRVWIERYNLTYRKHGKFNVIRLKHLRSFAKEHPELFFNIETEKLLWLFDDDETLVNKCLESSSLYPRKTRNKRVLCVETNEIYDTIKHASKKNFIDSRCIARSIKKGNIAGGFHWKLLD